MPIDRRLPRAPKSRLAAMLADLRTLVGGAAGSLIRVADEYDGLSYIDSDDGTTPAFTRIPSEGRVLGLHRERQGLSLLDYQQYVVGDDWSPALARMMADAKPGDRLNGIRGLTAKIYSPWLIDKPVDLAFGGTTLDAVGDNFRPDANGKIRYAIDCKTNAGTGTFGDNAAFGVERTITGTFPALIRTNPVANNKDGSAALRLNNVYYGKMKLSPITGFEEGPVLDCERTPGVTRDTGTTYCDIEISSLRNVRNLTFRSRKNKTAQADANDTDVGYCTQNRVRGGSYSTNISYANTPDDCQHATWIGGGWENNENYVEDASFEGTARRAVFAQGANHNNGVINCRYELPGVMNPGSYASGTAEQGRLDSKTVSFTASGGYFLDASKWVDAGYYNRISNEHYIYGLHDTFAGVTLTRDNWTDTRPSTKNWVPLGPSRYKYLAYTGTPLQLDLSLFRRFQIVVQADMPADAVTLVNMPTHNLLDYDFEVLLQQDATGRAIDAGWLTGIKYASFPVPSKRVYGTDLYSLSSTYRSVVGKTALLVRGHSSHNYSVGSGATNLTLPTATSLTYSGTVLTLDLSVNTRFKITLNQDMPAGAVTLANGSSTADIDAEILLLQNSGSGGWAVDPQWLKDGNNPIRYGHAPAPRKRNYGQDYYTVRRPAGGGVPLVRTWGSPNADPDQGDSSTVSGATPPALNVNTPTMQRFFNNVEKQLYLSYGANWYPSTPAATTSLKGTVKKAAALTTSLPASISNPPTQAEMQAVRDTVAELIANLKAAGQLG